MSTHAVIVLILGCGSQTSKGGASQPESVEEVASQLADAGLGCLNLRTPPKSEWNFGTESAIGVGECVVAGDDIEFILFGSSGEVEEYLSAGAKIGCALGAAFGLTDFDIVTSGVWTAEGMSRPVAERIAAAIGGKAHHITC
jgi:hypothetical protein